MSTKLSNVAEVEGFESPKSPQSYEIIKRSSVQDLPKLEGSTIAIFGRQFYLFTPTTVLKIPVAEGEVVMTDLAHGILRSVVPHVSGLVQVTQPRPKQGILIDRMPGTPIVELWMTFSLADQAKVKDNLVDLFVQMRTPHEGLDYYGRPNRQAYITPSDLSENDIHSFCSTYSEWNESRIAALHKNAEDAEIDEARLTELEQVQYETLVEGAESLVTQPVLTHGDLSERNILIDPATLEVTGLIDWELSCVAPAYFEYAIARLCGGHQPIWRNVLLEVLRRVLRIECDRQTGPIDRDLYPEVLAAWNALINVERSAQHYSDACYWTFEENDAELEREARESVVHNDASWLFEGLTNPDGTPYIPFSGSTGDAGDQVVAGSFSHEESIQPK